MARYISSTDSDDYYPPAPRQRHHSQPNDDRAYRLTSNLQDTTRNLKSLDHMVDDYTDVSRNQRSSLDRLRGELDRTQEDIRDERAREKNIDRDYGSDSENYGTASPRGRRRKRSAVRFADDMNRELHGIHQSVRDISSEQIKMEESFNRESDRRERHESDTKRSLRKIKDNVSPHPDPLSDRVERRLQLIQSEIRAEKHHLDRNRYDDLEALSTDLKSAIATTAAQTSQSQMDEKMRSHYLQSESIRHKVEGELDNVRRRLDQTEGSRHALQSQVEQLRSQLAQAESERQKVKNNLDESRIEDRIKEQHRKRTVEEERAHILERELHDMKTHLVRSVGAVSEMEEMRRRMEKSERQRAQLSDHIATLAKDLDNRDRQGAKVITQLKDISDKFDDADKQKKLLTVQLDDVQQKLATVSRECEKTTHELRNTQLSLQESEKKKDEFKGRAQETVRQWKAKVKSLERDLDRQKHGTGQMMARHEQLVKEMEGQKQHGNYSHMQMEQLKRELADALAVRAAQDEQIRLKDIEVNELKSVRMDIERDYRDTRTMAEKMDSEIHSLRSRLASVSEDKHRVEDKLSAVEAATLLAQDQSRSLQDDLKELSSIKAGIAAQLAETSSRNHDLNQAIVESQHKERAAREEVELYKKQLTAERTGLSKDYDTIKRELNEAKVREAHTMQEVNRKFRASNAENDAIIQALKMELSEEKSNSKILGRNADRLKEELDILEKRFRMTEEENMVMRRKIELVKNEFETQRPITAASVAYLSSQLAEDDLNRVKRLESQLGSAQMELEKLEKQQINLIQEIAIEIDALVETASVDATSRCQPINGLKNLVTIGGGIPTHLLTEIKNKIKWLRSEFRERLARERRLRGEFRTALSSSDADRQYLVSQLARKDDALEDLILEKKEMVYKEITVKNAVEDLEEEVLNLSGELSIRRMREDEQKKMFAVEKQNILEEMEDIMDAQKEKEKIEARYQRLQNTLKSLHNDLNSNDLNGNGKKTNGILRNGRSPSPSSRRRNHVRISTSTPTKEFCSDDPVSSSMSPAPMTLSDDEFRAKFMRTPQCVDG